MTDCLWLGCVGLRTQLGEAGCDLNLMLLKPCSAEATTKGLDPARTLNQTCQQRCEEAGWDPQMCRLWIGRIGMSLPYGKIVAEELPSGSVPFLI